VEIAAASSSPPPLPGAPASAATAQRSTIPPISSPKLCIGRCNESETGRRSKTRRESYTDEVRASWSPVDDNLAAGVLN